MRIQNKNLGETEITLRFTHHDGERVRVRGDARGIFDMPTRDAEFLLTTPGWSPVREAAPLDPTEPPAKPPEAPSAPKPVNLKPSAPGAPAAPPSAPAAPPPASPPETAAAKAEAAKVAALKGEIDSLRSKADAVAFAELHEIQGVDAEMKLSEMKEKITAALFVAEED